MYKHDYVIIGYDVSYCPIMSNEEFCESKLYEELTCYQSVGKIQIFDDPASGGHKYFGYILDASEECGDDFSTQYQLDTVSNLGVDVYRKLIEVFKTDEGISPLSLISFTEYR
jgi:hypothetical protein